MFNSTKKSFFSCRQYGIEKKVNPDEEEEDEDEEGFGSGNSKKDDEDPVMREFRLIIIISF